MRNRTLYRPAVLAALLVLALPALVLASTDRDRDRDEKTWFFGTRDGEGVSVSMEDGVMTIVSEEGGSESIRIIDVETMALMANDAIAEAMVEFEGLGELLAGMQVQWRAGQDNRVNLGYGDTEFEFDFDAVMTELAVAFEEGFDDFDASDWTSARDRLDASDEDELRAELRRLQDEMKDLERELRKLKDEAGER